MIGTLQIKNDLFYAVLNFKDKSGKRKQKWIPLQLPVKSNKRKAESQILKSAYRLIASNFRLLFFDL